MERLPARLYLAGRVAIEGRQVIDQTDLHGRQGRLALVELVVERHRPVGIHELATAVWGHEPPPSWESSLRAVVSRLRRACELAGADVTIASDAGCYQIQLPGGWVDLEAATNAVDEAEGALRRGDRGSAWSNATVAAGIAARPVLPGEDLPWVAAVRERVRTVWLRALGVLTELHLTDDPTLAISTARQLVEAEPYREAGHRLLIRALLAHGDRGDAVLVYHDLRRRLVDELGVEPAPETEAVYLQALRAGAPADRRPGPT